MKIKKGNQVKVITGKDKGKTGEVIEINRKLNMIKVKNINLVKKLPKAKGFSSILYPGERKNKTYKKNLKKDISIPSLILEEMEKLNAI